MSSFDVVVSQNSGQYSPNLSRLDRLAGELRHALSHTEQAQLKQWAVQTGYDFVKFGWKRVSNTGRVAKNLLHAAIGESADFVRAWRGDRLLDHLDSRYEALSTATSAAYSATVETVSILQRQLADNPAEAAPRLFSMVLASVLVSGGPDGDGGAPDLDLMFGIGAHRSIFTHSIIMGTALETAISAAFRLIQVVYGNLPVQHDRFWDTAINHVDDILHAVKVGSSVGMAYHLFVDGVFQTAAYKDLPISMPMEFHEGILVANAGAEAINATDLAGRFHTVMPAASCPTLKASHPNLGSQDVQVVDVTEHPRLHSHYRVFQLEREADRFARFLRAENASNVKVVPEGSACRVEYMSPSREPLWGHRSGSRYSSEEVKFIRRHYFLWVPIEDIARAVGRKESSLRFWLSKNDLYFLSDRDAYKPLRLPDAEARVLFDEMCEGHLSKESAALLKSMNILTCSALPESNINGELSLIDFAPEQQARVENFACAQGRPDAAARLTLLQGNYERGFVQARQANDMCFSLLALEKLESPSSLMQRARIVMTHYLRERFLTLFPKLWNECIAVGDQPTNAFSFTYANEELRIAKGKRLAFALRACMGSEPDTWHSDINDLYTFLPKHMMLTSQMSSRPRKYAPRIDRILGLLQQAMPFDEKESALIRDAKSSAAAGTLQFSN